MADEPPDIENRLQRLEAITAMLVAYDTDAWDSPEYEELVVRLLRPLFRGEPDDLSFLLRETLHARRVRGSSLRKRLRQCEETARQLQSLQSNTSQVTEAQAALKHRLDETAAQVSRVETQQARLNHTVTSNQQETHFFLALLSMGLELAQVKSPRLLPVRVYLTSDKGSETASVAHQVGELLAAFGFDVADDFPEERGSWWKKWFARTKDTLTQPEVQDRLKKIERALELQGLHKPQAEVDKNQAEAAKALLEGIKDQQHATAQVGSILVLKTTNSDGEGVVHVRQLSQKQLIAIENAPELLQSPGEALRLLGDACRTPQRPEDRVPHGRDPG